MDTQMHMKTKLVFVYEVIHLRKYAKKQIFFNKFSYSINIEISYLFPLNALFETDRNYA